MEQWKLPELRQSVGYQLQSFDSAFDHVHTPTSAPNSSGQSGANRNADASSLASLDELNKLNKLNNSLRLMRIKNRHQIIKSRLQARLDDQESKNRVLAARRDQLKQDEQLLASLKVMKYKIVATKYQERQLEKEIKSLDSAVWGYDMEGLLDELKEEEDNEEDKDKEEEDEGQSEEEEVHAIDYLEEESVVEEDSESNCSDDEDDY